MSQSTVSEKRTVITSSSSSGGYDALDDIPYKSNLGTRTNVISRSSLPHHTGGVSTIRTVEYGYGMGGMGHGGFSNVSNSGVTTVKTSREKEKKDLRDLNERFANYIEKVRFLEAQNRKLGGELDELRSKWGKETTHIKQMYEAELTEARKLIDDLSKDKAALEIKSSSIQEQNAELQRQLDEAKKYRQQDRDTINKLNQQLAEYESEINMLRRSMESLETERQRDKATINRLQQDVDKLRIDLNNETLAHLDAENRRQTLEEEMEFMKKVHEQELKELAALAYRDTTAENREFWKSELAQAIRDIQAEYDAKVDHIRGDMEGFYNLKIQEYRTGATKQNMEVTHIREENKKLVKQMSDLRGKLCDMEARNAQLEKQYNDVLRELETKDTDHMMECTQLREEISKLRAEMEGILTELQTLMDAKLSLELEIAAYRKLLEGEENRVDWRSRASMIMYRDAFRTVPSYTRSTRDEVKEKPVEPKLEVTSSAKVEPQDASPDTDAASNITMSDQEMSPRIEVAENEIADIPVEDVSKSDNELNKDSSDKDSETKTDSITPPVDHVVAVKKEIERIERGNDVTDGKDDSIVDKTSDKSELENETEVNKHDDLAETEPKPETKDECKIEAVETKALQAEKVEDVKPTSVKDEHIQKEEIMPVSAAVSEAQIHDDNIEKHTDTSGTESTPLSNESQPKSETHESIHTSSTKDLKEDSDTLTIEEPSTKGTDGSTDTKDSETSEKKTNEDVSIKQEQTSVSSEKSSKEDKDIKSATEPIQKKDESSCEVESTSDSNVVIEQTVSEPIKPAEQIPPKDTEKESKSDLKSPASIGEVSEGKSSPGDTSASPDKETVGPDVEKPSVKPEDKTDETIKTSTDSVVPDKAEQVDNAISEEKKDHVSLDSVEVKPNSEMGAGSEGKSKDVSQGSEEKQASEPDRKTAESTSSVIKETETSKTESTTPVDVQTVPMESKDTKKENITVDTERSPTFSEDIEQKQTSAIGSNISADKQSVSDVPKDIIKDQVSAVDIGANIKTESVSKECKDVDKEQSSEIKSNTTVDTALVTVSKEKEQSSKIESSTSDSTESKLTLSEAETSDTVETKEPQIQKAVESEVTVQEDIVKQIVSQVIESVPSATTTSDTESDIKPSVDESETQSHDISTKDTANTTTKAIDISEITGGDKTHTQSDNMQSKVESDNVVTLKTETVISKEEDTVVATEASVVTEVKHETNSSHTVSNRTDIDNNAMTKVEQTKISEKSLQDHAMTESIYVESSSHTTIEDSKSSELSKHVTKEQSATDKSDKPQPVKKPDSLSPEALGNTEDKVLESVVKSKVIETSPQEHSASVEASPTKELPDSMPGGGDIITESKVELKEEETTMTIASASTTVDEKSTKTKVEIKEEVTSLSIKSDSKLTLHTEDRKQEKPSEIEISEVSKSTEAIEDDKTPEDDDKTSPSEASKDLPDTGENTNKSETSDVKTISADTQHKPTSPLKQEKEQIQKSPKDDTVSIQSNIEDAQSVEQTKSEDSDKKETLTLEPASSDKSPKAISKPLSPSSVQDTQSPQSTDSESVAEESKSADSKQPPIEASPVKAETGSSPLQSDKIVNGDIEGDKVTDEVKHITNGNTTVTVSKEIPAPDQKETSTVAQQPEPKTESTNGEQHKSEPKTETTNGEQHKSEPKLIEEVETTSKSPNQTREGITEKIEKILLNGEDSQVSMKMMRGEVSAKTTYQRTSTGPIAICEAAADGKYILLENTSSGPKRQDGKKNAPGVDVNMDGWKLKRNVDGQRDYTYKFRNFTLKPGCSVKILARGAASEAGMNDLVFREEETWGFGSQVKTSLINDKGDEKASHVQKTLYN